MHWACNVKTFLHVISDRILGPAPPHDAACRAWAHAGCRSGRVRSALAVAGVVFSICALFAGCKPAAQPEHASPHSTLDKIRATGTIALGHRENSIPFSYFDNQQEVVG